jgi:hypothetical protein
MYDTRVEAPSPRKTLFEVLQSPGVAGATGGGGFSTAGAVPLQRDSGGIGAGLQDMAKNFFATRAMTKEQAAQDQAAQTAAQNRASALEARKQFLIDNNVSPERAGALAADDDTFNALKSQFEKDREAKAAAAKPDIRIIGDKAIDVNHNSQLLYDGSKPETKIIGGNLYTQQPDGTWKITVQTPSDYDQLNSDYQKAKANGYAGSLEDFAKIGKAGGTTVNVGGEGTNQKLNEGQAKDLSFYERGLYSNDSINSKQTELLNPKYYAVGGIPVIGNYGVSDDYRQAKQAADAWINTVILRRDSGAVINKDEYDKYWSVYMPMPGDDPKTIAQKEKLRQVTMDAIRHSLGNAQGAADEVENKFRAYKEQQAADAASTGTPAPTSPAPVVPGAPPATPNTNLKSKYGLD